MEKRREQLEAFGKWLRQQEKSGNTVEKYMRDARHFLEYLKGEEISPGAAIQYKEYLKSHYKISSVNSMVIAMNCYLKYLGKEECCVRTCRVQRQIFREEEKELTRQEYQKLVLEAKKQGNRRLACLIQTLGMTGIRVSELEYITVEALKNKAVQISNKGKTRMILLPESLKEMLRRYCGAMKIKRGSIFITKSGRPLDRRNIWAQMKELCLGAGVKKSKVFPHNFRHLFARCYYEREKDLVRLADFLGHSSIETTRRYTMISTMEACLKQLELGLIVGEKKWEMKMEM